MDQTLIMLALVALSALDVAISIAIQRTISNAEKLYHLQRRLNEHMKDFKEMQKRKASQAEMLAKQNEMMKISMETTKHQMRAMPILFVVSLAFYFFILPSIFPAGQHTLNLLVTTVKYNGFQDSLFFIVVTFFISLLVQSVLRRRDERVFGKKYEAMRQAGTEQGDQISQSPQNQGK
ncbi:MAG: hypothetical protein QXF01_01465 [Candidatus Micrarchaeaceae archaeon]